MITLLVMTDGRRDCIERTIHEALWFLEGPIRRRVIHDDSGDPANSAWLQERFPTFEVVCSPRRLGFAGAIDRAWAFLRATDESPFIFHLEDDFLIHRYVSLRPMIETLDHHPELVQLALLRDAVNADERRAGGVMQQHPDDYKRRVCEECGAIFHEHRRFFTTNPSVYHRELMERTWPLCANSEGHFSIRLFSDPALRSAFWRDGEHVEHIGHTRVGTGY